MAIYQDKNQVIEVLRVAQMSKTAYAEIERRQRKCTEYLNDNQWTAEEVNAMLEQKRTPITVNIMRNYQLQVLGKMAGMRSDIVVEPFDTEIDPLIADVVQKLLAQSDYLSHQTAHDEQVFLDGLSGIGAWEVYQDFYDDPLGYVKSSRIAPYMTLFDIDSYMPDLSDCKYVIRYVYMTKDRIKRKFGFELNTSDFDNWKNDLGSVEGMQSIEPMPYVNGMYLVIEMFERTYKMVSNVINNETGNIEHTFDAGQVDNMQLRLIQESLPNHSIIKRHRKYIKSTIILPYGWNVLQVTEEPYDYYPIVPFMSVRSGERYHKGSSYNYTMTAVQDELNMRISNAHETLVRSMRGGYFVHDGNGDGQQLVDELNKAGGKLGVTFKYSGPVQPIPITDPSIYQNIVLAEGGMRNYMEAVSGIGSGQAYGGAGKSGESGVLRQMKAQESNTTLLPIMSAFLFAKKMVTEAKLERLIPLLTAQRVVRIIGESGTNYLQITTEMLRNIRSVAKWDIRTLESPYATAHKQSELDKMLGLLQIIAPINPMAANLLLPKVVTMIGASFSQEISQQLEQLILAEVGALKQQGSAESTPQEQ